MSGGVAGEKMNPSGLDHRSQGIRRLRVGLSPMQGAPFNWLGIARSYSLTTRGQPVSASLLAHATAWPQARQALARQREITGWALLRFVGCRVAARLWVPGWRATAQVWRASREADRQAISVLCLRSSHDRVANACVGPALGGQLQALLRQLLLRLARRVLERGCHFFGRRHAGRGDGRVFIWASCLRFSHLSGSST